jgi:hypothetical protein
MEDTAREAGNLNLLTPTAWQNNANYKQMTRNAGLASRDRISAADTAAKLRIAEIVNSNQQSDKRLDQQQGQFDKSFGLQQRSQRFGERLSTANFGLNKIGMKNDNERYRLNRADNLEQRGIENTYRRDALNQSNEHFEATFAREGARYDAAQKERADALQVAMEEAKRRGVPPDPEIAKEWNSLAEDAEKQLATYAEQLAAIESLEGDEAEPAQLQFIKNRINDLNTRVRDYRQSAEQALRGSRPLTPQQQVDQGQQVSTAKPSLRTGGATNAIPAPPRDGGQRFPVVSGKPVTVEDAVSQENITELETGIQEAGQSPPSPQSPPPEEVAKSVQWVQDSGIIDTIIDSGNLDDSEIEMIGNVKQVLEYGSDSQKLDALEYLRRMSEKKGWGAEIRDNLIFAGDVALALPDQARKGGKAVRTSLGKSRDDIVDPLINTGRNIRNIFKSREEQETLPEARERVRQNAKRLGLRR